MQVLAPVVGSLSQQHCGDGATVKAGESLGEIECMKMLYSIAAPCDGIVRWVAGLGSFVGEGEVIAEITPGS